MPGSRHREGGATDAPTVLFCPALGTTLEVWEPQVRHLSARLRTLRYDLPGHGGETGATPGTTMAELGHQALAVLDSHGVVRASVAGLSLGGMVALWLALHAPHRIESLVLCATAAWLGPQERWLDRAALVRAEGLEPIAESILGRWIDWDDRELPSGLEDICRRMLAATTPEGFAACSEAVAGFDVRHELAGVQMPTTIMIAEHDEATTAIDARALASGIPRARLSVLGGGSHLLSLAKPAEITDAIWRTVSETL